MEQYSQHFLYPSTLFASKEPYVVKTILGSCVAICLWDPVTRIGGINHYMLPNWNGNDLASPKYGNIAIDKLLEKMGQLGARRENLKAKIFGGGELIESGANGTLIGERNIRVARLILEEKKIPVVASSTGGRKGRKILFFTDSGEVRHKFLDKKAQ
ncbi:chemotaxis protein CheD [Marinilabilia salmonicolor]|jgi:chemotaxis protein CheD|uniref:Probable chemoreceptor glutamine deamidase CheD n=1 Tax=Marinilabilia salmonicolor TaxID=989 RepID=A0A2T0XR40_9BACT|nr:chemotaxis protein CheD [Marinilabilia salmonicolor]PRZ01383.1 CheD activator of MCP protein methylation [Marinilabilia salmonicolor]RCW29523.1 CheD activator of MCP protein methylation [Marinilabilia salmonicolor]